MDIRQNWRVWPNGFDADYILSLPKQMQKATTFGGFNADARRSQIAWIDSPKVKQMLWPFILESSKIMGIDVSPVCEVQYTEYHANENGAYNWHHDVDFEGIGLDRKLSLTIQLDDSTSYTGGDFEFMGIQEKPPYIRDKGTVLVFPSIHYHRVTPVTQGVRRSLVAWFKGPQWR